MNDIVIIGAGVAGLSCLNFFLDKGVSPLLIEASVIGMPKVCGEFIAPRAARQLEAWNITGLQQVTTAHFYARNKHLEFSFQTSAAGLQRSAIELQLFERATKLKGQVRTKTQVVQITQNGSSGFLLTLHSKEVIATKQLVIASRHFCKTPTHFPYVGCKTYSRGKTTQKTLQMFGLPGAYFGIVPVSDSVYNIACLITKKALMNAGSIQNFIDLHAPALLKEQLSDSLEWQQAAVARFGKHKHPIWPHAFVIGDAASSFPPATGSGCSQAIFSAQAAVNVCLSTRPQPAFLSLTTSKVLHHILMRPKVASLCLCWLQKHPHKLQYLTEKL